MHMSRAGQINGTLFVSAKTSTAIPARCALVRDALVQASLDPAVRSIDFIASARVGATPVDLNATVIHGSVALPTADWLCSSRGSAGVSPAAPSADRYKGGDFQRQYDLNPARCQRTMVSGFKIANASHTLGNNR